jgi:nascent polypeptide-associated complex subunit alpha
MMPNMDPRTMKNMLAKMGIKTEEISAIRVTIETSDRNIVIENPQITKISAQGSVSFQVGGNVREEEKQIAPEVTEDDIKLVMEQTGVNDEQKVRDALSASNGDIAAAILALKKEDQ